MEPVGNDVFCLVSAHSKIIHDIFLCATLLKAKETNLNKNIVILLLMTY